MTPTHTVDRVAQALECGYDEMCTLVTHFTTSDQLDRFSRSYNANDGFEPLCCVVGHPECGAGTALFIYWQFHELPGDPQARATLDGEPARWNANALLCAIERRYPDGFRLQGIACDPIADCARAFGPAYVESIRAQHKGSPLMQPPPAPSDAKESPR